MSRPALTLRGSTAVVTGAGSGIGRALALKAAAEGMAVALCDVDERGLEITLGLLRKKQAPSVARRADVTDAAALGDFSEATKALPAIVLLFANAGVLRSGSILDMAPAEWRLLYDINVHGTLNTLRAFAPALLTQRTPAQIVITGSTGSMSSADGLGAYCGAKHALLPIAEELRRDLAARGAPIGVSLLMPGAVTTHIFDAVDPHRPVPVDSISPDVAANIAFAGARADHPLILTHPAFVRRARARFDQQISDLDSGSRRDA